MSTGHEILVVSNGEQFTVREIGYSDWVHSIETHPCIRRERDGTDRHGKIEIAVETAEVRFYCSPGSPAVEQTGQLSCGDSLFHEVTILLAEEAGDAVRVTARARRSLGFKILE